MRIDIQDLGFPHTVPPWDHTERRLQDMRTIPFDDTAAVDERSQDRACHGTWVGLGTRQQTSCGK